MLYLQVYSENCWFSLNLFEMFCYVLLHIFAVFSNIYHRTLKILFFASGYQWLHFPLSPHLCLCNSSSLHTFWKLIQDIQKYQEQLWIFRYLQTISFHFLHILVRFWQKCNKILKTLTWLSETGYEKFKFEKIWLDREIIKHQHCYFFMIYMWTKILFWLVFRYSLTVWVIF